MTREIKFRGLRIDGKGWVYGDLWREHLRFGSECKIYVADGDEEIEDTGWIQVSHLSVGQFTGLYDKNGVEIYEGDIMSYNEAVKFETKVKNVCHGHGHYGESTTVGFVFDGYYGSPQHLEVIGNAHESEVTSG